MYTKEEKERNWASKDTSKNQAIKHTEEMAAKYTEKINWSIAHTYRFNDGHLFENPKLFERSRKDTKIILMDKDSVSAVMDAPGRTTVLNFASFKFPGGMFLKGSMAQEEALCHESFLYNVLSVFDECFYKPHELCLNKGLYTDESLYSRGIVFEKNGCIRMADVITCAAPNASAAMCYKMATEEDVKRAMEKRIFHILHMAHYMKTETLVLGAFGCGGAMCC